MTTGKFDFKDDEQNSEWVNQKSTIDDYLKNASEAKYNKKAKRMIRTVLKDGTVIIGKNRYDALKKTPSKSLVRNQTKEIKDFEDYHGITEAKENVLNKWKEQEIKEAKRQKKLQNIIKNITPKNVEILFKKYYKKHYKREFIENKETLKNLKPLMFYFSKDRRFLNYGCKDDNNEFLSQPSFDKGLCIVGGFGNGKTSIMNTMQRIFIGIPGYNFGRYSSNEIVKKYEQLSRHKSPEHIESFWQQLTRSTLYIDDVKAEPLALAYGKTNVLNSLFQERYNKDVKTYISLNYTKGYNGNVSKALEEFKEKYSLQVYDRIFEMYNILEFKGKSFRR